MKTMKQIVSKKLGFGLQDSEVIAFRSNINESIPVNILPLLDLQKEIFRKTEKAYRALNESKLALDNAIQSNHDQALWQLACDKAQTADDALKQLVSYKLKNKLFSINRKDLVAWGGLSTIDARFFDIPLLTIVIVTYYIIFMFQLLSISNLFVVSSESWRVMTNFNLAFALFKYKPLRSLCSQIGITLSNMLVSTFDPQSQTQQVLCAANTAGIKLNLFISGKNVDDSASLISTLVNSVNQLEERERIKWDDVPHHMCCSIMHTIMTDPVGCDQSADRFERTAILKWLKIHEIHPFTKQALTPEELKRDFKLHTEITHYVSNKLSENGFKKYKNGSLVRLSLFQPLDQTDVETEEKNESSISSHHQLEKRSGPHG